MLSKRPHAGRVGRTAAAACAVLVLASAAYATDAGKSPTAIVRYSDLDIATSDGAAALYQRIRAAARHVCPDVDSVQLAQHMLAAKCREQATDRAVRSIHSPLLAAVRAVHRRPA